MIYFTSDLHFEHANIIKYNPKTRSQFKDITHMREWMIAEWNKTIKPEDEVYILGDIGFTDPATMVSILVRLNGIKYLIEGNHDNKLMQSEDFRKCFARTYKYFELRVKNDTFVLFHYPIKEWNKAHRGAYHLHGHLHGNESGLEHLRCMDVAYDATGEIAISIDSVIKKLDKKEILRHH